jgi:hypothetical protein
MKVTELLQLAKKHGIAVQKVDEKGKKKTKKRGELLSDLSVLCNPSEEINIVQ